MNPWPFVVAAYALTIGATVALLLWAWVGDACSGGRGRRAQASMKPKNQRLVLVVAALVALIAAVLLAMSASRSRRPISSRRPTSPRARPSPGAAMRLGGMVEKGSVERQPDGVRIRFTVSDGKATTPVVFRGIVPDLFREGSGVVAEGRMKRTGVRRRQHPRQA